MADRTFWYGRVDPGYGRYRYELKLPTRIDLTDEHDLQDLAELAADDYHSNHDGWEASWPLTLAIAATEDGPELARFEVERDVEPVFSARRTPGVEVSDEPYWLIDAAGRYYRNPKHQSNAGVGADRHQPSTAHTPMPRKDAP